MTTENPSNNLPYESSDGEPSFEGPSGHSAVVTKEKRNNVITLFHQNIQGFSSKILMVELFLEKYRYDIVCFTEHFQRNYQMLFNFKNYNCVSSFSRQTTTHGGSLILVRNHIKAKERQDIVGLAVERSIELSCIELESYIVVCAYRPPDNNNFYTFLSVMEEVLGIICRSKKHVIVCGDFNCDLLEQCWFSKKHSNEFLSLFKSFDLKNLFIDPTRVTDHSATCIDNIFCKCSYIDKSIISSLKSDHTGQSVSLPYKQESMKIDIKSRPITCGRLDKYSEALLNNLPDIHCTTDDPHKCYAELFSVIRSEFDRFFKVIKKQINVKFKFSDWATKGIRKSRDKLFELYELRNYDTSDRFKEYLKMYSKLFSKICAMAKSNHLISIIKSSDDKIKAVWKIINTETGRVKSRDSNIKLKLETGVILDKHTHVAQEFETFFTNIPIKTTQPLNSSAKLAISLLKENVANCNAEFKFRYVTSQTVIKVFKDIKIKSTEDLWGMSVRVCGGVIEILAPHLANMFNVCIDKGTFPDLMKCSKVVPLFKSGDKMDPGNFRPVSVLPVLSKIFEKLMLLQMSSFFAVNNLFHAQQYGFTKGKCTTDAGVTLLKHIFSAWEDKHDAIGVFCDLSKAFDCVDYETLLLKLDHYGVKGQSLNLLKSYLENRMQHVQINDVKSQGSCVKMGVPQGSILGPFLFLVYVNDLPFMVENLSKIVLFADDTSLIFKVSRLTHNYDEINDTLRRIHDWFTINNLSLNAKKTKCVKFVLPNVKSLNHDVMLNNEKLEFVDSTVFLGITLDAKLQWNVHIKSLSGRLSSAAYAVWKIRQLTDVATSRLVYFSYFHSVMSYGILLWGGAADFQSIFILQKRAIRAIYKLRRRDSLRELFKEINILTVPCQYIYEVIMYARRNLDQFTKNSDNHNYNTRNKNKFVLPHFRLSKVSKSFDGLCVRYYNKIPVEITCLPDNKFKAIVKRILCRKAYYKLSDYLSDKTAWCTELPAPSN